MTTTTKPQPWRPSNGTEGEIFTYNRCDKCVNDRFDNATMDGESCPIWMTLLIGENDPHVYWDDAANHGECDMFQERPKSITAFIDALDDELDRDRWADSADTLREIRGVVDRFRAEPTP